MRAKHSVKRRLDVKTGLSPKVDRKAGKESMFRYTRPVIFDQQMAVYSRSGAVCTLVDSLLRASHKHCHLGPYLPSSHNRVHCEMTGHRPIPQALFKAYRYVVTQLHHLRPPGATALLQEELHLRKALVDIVHIPLVQIYH